MNPIQRMTIARRTHLGLVHHFALSDLNFLTAPANWCPPGCSQGLGNEIKSQMKMFWINSRIYYDFLSNLINWLLQYYWKISLNTLKYFLKHIFSCTFIDSHPPCHYSQTSRPSPFIFVIHDYSLLLLKPDGFIQLSRERILLEGPSPSTLDIWSPQYLHYALPNSALTDLSPSSLLKPYGVHRAVMQLFVPFWVRQRTTEQSDNYIIFHLAYVRLILMYWNHQSSNFHWSQKIWKTI